LLEKARSRDRQGKRERERGGGRANAATVQINKICLSRKVMPNRPSVPLGTNKCHKRSGTTSDGLKFVDKPSIWTVGIFAAHGNYGNDHPVFEEALSGRGGKRVDRLPRNLPLDESEQEKRDRPRLTSNEQDREKGRERERERESVASGEERN